MVSVKFARGWSLWAAVAAASCVSINPAFAQPATLASTFREAATSNPTIRARQNDLQAAGFDLDGAKWGRYPSFSAQASTELGGARTVLRLEQPLWTGGRITGRISSATAGQAEAEAAVSAAQQEILQQTASAFFDILRLESRLKTAEANESEHQRLLETIGRRVQAEVSPMTDQTQAAARTQQAISDVIQTRRLLESARSLLHELVGRPVPQVVAPSRIDVRLSSEAAALEAALAFSPERKRLLAQIDVAQAEIEVARAQLMPQLVAGYVRNVGKLQLGEDRGRAFVGLQAQTGAGLSSLSAVQSAQARRFSASDKIASYDRQLAQQVRSNWTDLQSLGAQLEPVRALLKGSDELVASYLRQFQVGRKNWLDVLNAQREKTQAYYSLADIESPLALAKIRLMLLTGQLNAQNLDQIHD